MSFRFLSHEQINEDDWQSFVDRHLSGTIFHTPGLFAIHASTPHYEPYAFFLMDSQGNICAMLQGFIHTIIPGLGAGLSRRSVMLQSPLFTSILELSSLIDGYRRFANQKAVLTEIRNHISSPNVRPLFESRGFVYTEHLNYLVDCSVPETAWKNISESKRRQIKKALKQDVRIVDDPTEDQVRDFYLILKRVYKEKIKKPLAPYEYLLKLYKVGSGEYGCKFLLVEYHTRIIGGMVALISGKKAIHEHYIAGLDTDYKDQYPSVMATWAAIDFASRNGILKFDFMGAGNPNIDYGVREFKARFGGELTYPGRYQIVHSKIKHYIAEKGFYLYQKLNFIK